MSTTYYRLYKEKVMELASSLVIKSEATANSINQYLESLGYVISDDPTTWKYYLHLAGEPHFLDQPMEIVSLDTMDPIEFNKENLREHLATAEEYRVGTRYYNELVERFPDQEMLIRGMLNPVDIHTAIAADDYSILFADQRLIESNETNLITKLQERVTRFSIRWNVPGYHVTDDLYNAAHLGILYSNLPLFIMNIRLENCRTAQAHSFHIREYLASHGRLDRYLDYLTKKQMLFLYRNVLYIERNAGKQETFEWLVERLLSERTIPLAEYRTRHNLSEMPESFYPDLELKRTALNRHHNPSSSDERTLSQMLELEDQEAPGNRRVMEDTYKKETRRFRNNRINRLPTKVLESAIVDRTDSGFITMYDYLLNHWLYWSTTGRYRSTLSVPDPRSGEKFQVSAQDAFTMFLYCYNRSMGVTLENVPDVMAIMVRKHPLPKRKELRAITEERYVPDWMLDEVLARPAIVSTYVSTYAFQDAVAKIYDRANEHREFYSLQEHFQTRGQLQGASDHLYQNVMCTLDPQHSSYSDWFYVRGLDVPNLTVLEHELLANSLLQEATGLSLQGSRGMVELQNSLLRLMQQLSSYTVQFLKEINRGPIRVYDWSVVRTGDQDMWAGHVIRAETPNQRVHNVWGRGHSHVSYEVPDLSKPDIWIRSKHYVPLDIRIDHKLLGRVTMDIRVRLPMPQIRVVEEPGTESLYRDIVV